MSDLPEALEPSANPGRLRMFLYVPPDLPAGSPLVVTLHGCGQRAAPYAEAAGWYALADRFGFAVLSPEQQRRNNLGLCFNWFMPGDQSRGAGEPASIVHMVDLAIATHNLDAGRVHVTGLSAGGAMAAVLLATYPDRFAGGAIFAGLPYGAATGLREALSVMKRCPVLSAQQRGDRVRAASRWTGPWPTLSVWHGEDDDTVDPGAAVELVHQWLDLHGIAAGPQRRASADGHPYGAWTDGHGATKVELHLIPGLGHGVPLANGAARGGGRSDRFMIDAGIDSSLNVARSWGLDPAAR